VLATIAAISSCHVCGHGAGNEAFINSSIIQNGLFVAKQDM